ncbi:class I SAM-dependent methyltransferase [Sphingomonas sp.]|uniref:class I SAM-dependent methyltransferase n=1 Tax=Sphingomonas sp. TaxID=28214 RepID=UPI0035BC114F
MTRAITLDGFDAMFAGNDDPWSTFAARDEAHKRDAILHALGHGPLGRVLELAAGNGSNSVALAKRTLRLDATEGTEAGTALVRKAVGDDPRVRVERLVLPRRFPRTTYDAIVVAEILYYLTARAMAQVARDTARALRPGGTLVLAHHRIDFHDFAQHADAIHARFLRDTGVTWHAGQGTRTGRWKVRSYRPR